MPSRSFVALRLFCLMCILALGACATTKPAQPEPTPEPSIDAPDLDTAPIATPEPEIEVEPEPDSELGPESAPSTDPDENPPTPEPIIENDPVFEALSYWTQSDPTPALHTLRESCKIWSKRSGDVWLHSSRHQYGQIKDWREACDTASLTPLEKAAAILFFQTHFAPVQLDPEKNAGLLTGYYAPEIDARRQASTEFSEPVLARPLDPKTQTLPRKDIGVHSAKVLAYGRPIDVFFLQIQGSGRLKFADGKSYRAAFDGHNGHRYVSIGKHLVARGELTLEQASKQSIEEWMRRAGQEAARALMNENPRYIFFKTGNIIEGQGPRGAMGAPLTAMGSIAVDPRYHPYGALIWLNAKLPIKNGDYNGAETGLLVSAQDTGGDIKGENRGDLYFGAGADAGEKAGVMKHRAIWTLFLPRALVRQATPIS